MNPQSGPAKRGDITELLHRLSAGDRSVESELLARVYGELHRMAERCFRKERQGHTLQVTALVNEAYLRMGGHQSRNWQGREHFFASAAQAMRRILTDHARASKAVKRGGEVHRVALDAELVPAGQNAEVPFVELDDALSRLAEFAPRQARVVELRFFGGLTESEVANLLQLSERTVMRDWKAAKAWLFGELEKMGVTK